MLEADPAALELAGIFERDDVRHDGQCVEPVSSSPPAVDECRSAPHPGVRRSARPLDGHRPDAMARCRGRVGVGDLGYELLCVGVDNEPITIADIDSVGEETVVEFTTRS